MRRKKNGCTCLSFFFSPGEGLKHLKLMLLNSIYFFPMDLLFSGFCSNSSNASCAYSMLLYVQNDPENCMRTRHYSGIL